MLMLARMLFRLRLFFSIRLSTALTKPALCGLAVEVEGIESTVNTKPIVKLRVNIFFIIAPKT
jgi:hypothetical protein